MKKILPLLLLLSIGLADFAAAQPRPRLKAKRAFAHNSEAGKGKTNKARFRRENNVRPVIDLNPHRLERTKTVKALKPYKYSKGM